MFLKPVMSAPLPWLTIVAGRLLGKKTPEPKRGKLLRWPRSLSFTREGKWYTGVLLIIGVAAINTGNNLLYLIVATLLSIIIISGVMSESTLRDIRVKRALPRRAYKGKPAQVRIRITNAKKRLPSFSFTVRDTTENAEASPSYVLKLKPGTETVLTPQYTFKNRGRQKLDGFRITTRFPFGLFLKGKLERSDDEFIVYPSTSCRLKRPLGLGAASSGQLSRAVKGEGVQLYGLRDYTFEDDSRHIHWKSAGRLTKLLVKEFEREAERKVTVVFDNLESSLEAFEEAVDEAATIASRYMDIGYSVGLKTLTFELEPRQGQDQLDAILHHLALIKPAGKGTPDVRVQ